MYAGDEPPPPLDHKLTGIRKTADMLKKVSSAETLTRLKDKIMARGGGGGASRDRSPPRDEPASDSESAPLVASAGSPAPIRVECGDRSLPDASGSDFSPRSDMTELESPREGATAFDLLPEGKGESERGGGARLARDDSAASLSNMVEPYNMRLLSRGASDARALWRQDALDSGPPWPWDEPDSAV